MFIIFNYQHYLTIEKLVAYFTVKQLCYKILQGKLKTNSRVNIIFV